MSADLASIGLMRVPRDDMLPPRMLAAGTGDGPTRRSTRDRLAVAVIGLALAAGTLLVPHAAAKPDAHERPVVPGLCLLH